MLRDFLQRFRSDDSALRLYGTIVAQARQRAFYANLHVPDTLDGRFDMIVLHVVLVMRRLKREGEAGRRVSQALAEAFFGDMDRSLREMGVGDLVVPKRVRRMAEAFYGRAAAYESALAAEGDESLEGALTRNILGDAAPQHEARLLADYVRHSVENLEGKAYEQIVAGELHWGDLSGLAAQPLEDR